MHLDRLEKAGLVRRHLELSDDGKAMKYFELVPFRTACNGRDLADALAADPDGSTAESLKTEKSKDD